jgi:hypothetical protein
MGHGKTKTQTQHDFSSDTWVILGDIEENLWERIRGIGATRDEWLQEENGVNQNKNYQNKNKRTNKTTNQNRNRHTALISGPSGSSPSS